MFSWCACNAWIGSTRQGLWQAFKHHQRQRHGTSQLGSREFTEEMRGARAVVLGYTEIPLGIAAGPALPFPVADTIDALARAAIGWAKG